MEGHGNAYKHGHSVGKISPTYRSWHAMVRRCYDTTNDNYMYYGGRGITVEPKWLKFEGFLEDMGERPEGATISRKDNNGNYCKANCEWETSWSEQMKNRRNTIWVEYNGERMTLTDFAKNHSTVKRQALCNRRAQGWSTEKIVETYGKPVST